MQERTYIAIDLKSFYASVECIERGLDPMNTNLVVADAERTEKTICLAVSPSLKAYGIPGRARLFEVIAKVKEANTVRKSKAPGHQFTGSSYFADELKKDHSLAIDYIAAPPQMAHYMEYSTRIYQVYLKYIAPEDIHVYSIDEVMIDATSYMNLYGLSARELTKKIIQDIQTTTGITATAGIGTNLYLCKIAMDIMAKHTKPDEDGVRIACLDEMSYRKNLWSHQPLTDFWRVGRGYAKKLQDYGLYTMGDIARCSIGKPSEYYNEELLYKLFGINAELLIDHAWGWEPCTISEVKAYKPENNSIVSGQVLKYPYTFQQARLVIQEMADLMSLDLVDKGLTTDQIVLHVGYDIENLTDPERRKTYTGPVKVDRYGRKVPQSAHGTKNLQKRTSSTRLITEAVLELYDEIMNRQLLIRRISITANRLLPHSQEVNTEVSYEQMNLFTDYAKLECREKQEKEALEKEEKMQQAVLSIKKRYGKNAILKGMNLQEGATAMERNNQIGGHRA